MEIISTCDCIVVSLVACLEVLVRDYGFTNLHVTGPEGEAGFLKWLDKRWETKENDTYDFKHPKCSKKCYG
jgi:hypothetical protein